jgi:antitoxin component of MazEF toxin-antitoxin module
VVPTILEGDCAFEIPDELYKQFNLNAGDSVSFKKQIGDRYSMIIHRNGKEK